MPTGVCLTTALPYANGDLHLGHILEQVQADIWCRFLKLQGCRCLFVGGDDAHGTAIMLSAQKAQVTPEEWIAKIWSRHYADICDFSVDMDMFYTTRSDENKNLVETIYARLKENGAMVTKTVQQAYDTHAEMFLPDRFIRGECPRCNAKDQYGDHCEVCGSYYLPTALKNPYSVLTKTVPETRTSEHIFFQLSARSEQLSHWITQANLQSSVENKLREWLNQGLQDWDISRDAPYFGFKIPDYTDKYFYVWMDAPIGYMSAIAHYDSKYKTNYCEAIFSLESDWDLVHFIGKDLVNFHGVFWPTVLTSAGFRAPSHLQVHGFITVNGEKMSKSKGTFVTARAYLNVLSPEYLRYYFACKLSDSVVDIDLNWADFVARCNADLIGKVINIGSRSASFVHKYFSGRLADQLDHEVLLADFVLRGNVIAELYHCKRYSMVVREIMALADRANQYINEKKPWLMAKDPQRLAEVCYVCTTALHLFWVLGVYISPIVPKTASKIAAVFDQEIQSWQDAERTFFTQKIQPFPRILERITYDMCPVL